MVNRERLFDTFIQLCRIPSPSGREGRVAAYIRQRVSALGLTVEEDDAGAALGSDTGNLLVRLPGNQNEALFFSAHMDTVPVPPGDEVPVVVEGDRVHTGGRSPLGGDDKAGIAVALELLACAVESPTPARPLEMAFTIQEEQGARGAAYLDPHRLHASYGFVLDGDTPVGTAIRHSPSKVRFYVDILGRKAHAAVDPEKGINAIKAVGAVAAALPTGRLSEISVANLGYIEGGGTINAVPEKASLVGELRSLEKAVLQDLKQQFEEIIHNQAASHGATATVRWEELYDGYYVSNEAPCARLFAQACRKEGLTPSFLTTLGGGDANPFNNKGLRCIVFGLGMESIHSNDEYMLLSRLAQATRILHHLVGLPLMGVG